MTPRFKVGETVYFQASAEHAIGRVLLWRSTLLSVNQDNTCTISSLDGTYLETCSTQLLFREAEMTALVLRGLAVPDTLVSGKNYVIEREDYPEAVSLCGRTA